MAFSLEKHLVLYHYFLDLLGFEDFHELREKLKDQKESYRSDGQSEFFNVLIGLKNIKIERERLEEYDKKIRGYVEKLRGNRKQPGFNLKYFQYLAVLFAEAYLDKYFGDKDVFLKELNAFLEEYNEKHNTSISAFTKKDLKKIAFWMATGSGKTLIMHINYWQALNYSAKEHKGRSCPWENIVLITPNEGLSKQHCEELRRSGIPCRQYEGNPDNLRTEDKEVLVIDIYKLTKEKKGEGVSVDVSYFEGNNLVFIDEGHKGQKSEEQKWKKIREKLGEKGFILEYSATFGQVIGKNKELLEEYAKTIIFDYSYKYFYTDGYGKDFHIFNIQTDNKQLKQEYSEKQQALLLTAGLLSFYEQLVIFNDLRKNNSQDLKELNIEKPLWVFVGSKVTGKGINSDVVKIIQFLNKIIEDREYLKENVEKILSGKSGLLDNNGGDVFKNNFQYLKKKYKSNGKGLKNKNNSKYANKADKREGISVLIEDIYELVFGGKGKLDVYRIRNAEGEIGLKTTTGEKYFGVISVGDARALMKLFSQKGIEIREDHFTQSLFYDINSSYSPINILVGSKKFIEGWDSWRVSTMGLINMGKGEGPQIVQLFGRGVRLKGKNYSLKREENPDYEKKTLQTLFIFGLNADYMNAFLTAMNKEEVDFEEIRIPIKFNQPEKWEGKIYTIKTSDEFDFLKTLVKLDYKDDADKDLLRKITIDLRPKLLISHSSELANDRSGKNKKSVKKHKYHDDNPLKIPDYVLEIIDWDYIYLETMKYKTEQRLYNLALNREAMKKIIKSRQYKVFIPETEGIKITRQERKEKVLAITSFKGLEKLHDVFIMVLKEYIYKYYRREEKRKTMEHLTVEKLTRQHKHMFPRNEEIVLKVPNELVKEFEDLIRQIEEYKENTNHKDNASKTNTKNVKAKSFKTNGDKQKELEVPDVWRIDVDYIPTIYFDKHLYVPLVVYKRGKEKIKSFPVKLNEGETKFLEDLRTFLNKNKEFMREKEVFLLRNLSKKGIGFFINSGFYPDFILWVKKKGMQRIVFVDPKGIRNLGNFNDEKIQLCTSYIKEIEKKINDQKDKSEIENVMLDAFIVSVTPYNDIKKLFGNGNHSEKDFEKHHVLFQENKNYIEKILVPSQELKEGKK